MNKRLVWALALIGLVVVVLVAQRGRVDVDLFAGSVRGVKALVFLGFSAVGVVIGSLLK